MTQAATGAIALSYALIVVPLLIALLGIQIAIYRVDRRQAESDRVAR